MEKNLKRIYIVNVYKFNCTCKSTTLQFKKQVYEERPINTGCLSFLTFVYLSLLCMGLFSTVCCFLCLFVCPFVTVSFFHYHSIKLCFTSSKVSPTLHTFICSVHIGLLCTRNSCRSWYVVTWL